jgi:Domain of unknown function (DUF4395)
VARPATRPAMVDRRQPRLGQAITGILLLVGFVLDAEAVIPAVGLLLGAAAVLGPRFNPYAALFRGLRRASVVGPPRELEEAGPPRFANGVGLTVLTVATLALALGATGLAWGLALAVSSLALLSAITGLCVGCELYVIGRRGVTRGRSSGRILRQDVEAAT